MLQRKENKEVSMVNNVAVVAFSHHRDLCRASVEGRTFGSEVLDPLHIVHGLEGLCLLPGKGLLVIVLARATDAVEEDAARVCVLEEVDEDKDGPYQEGGAEGGEQADHDAIQGVGRSRRHGEVKDRAATGSGQVASLLLSIAGRRIGVREARGVRVCVVVVVVVVLWRTGSEGGVTAVTQSSDKARFAE